MEILVNLIHSNIKKIITVKTALHGSVKVTFLFLTAVK